MCVMYKIGWEYELTLKVGDAGAWPASPRRRRRSRRHHPSAPPRIRRATARLRTRAAPSIYTQHTILL